MVTRLLLFIALLPAIGALAQPGELIVSKTTDFVISGKGDAKAWTQAEWITLEWREGEMKYGSRVKLLYSDSGLYCLYHCEDKTITSTMKEDYSDLWKEDVVEIFLWPDESFRVYFEYELSPNNFELPIIVPNVSGKFFGWRPWHYTGARKVKHKTSITSEAWIAEFFIPFALMTPLSNVPPKSGTVWRCNMYRVDHDKGSTEWSWMPVKTNFHEIESFGRMKFR